MTLFQRNYSIFQLTAYKNGVIKFKGNLHHNFDFALESAADIKMRIESTIRSLKSDLPLPSKYILPISIVKQ